MFMLVGNKFDMDISETVGLLHKPAVCKILLIDMTTKVNTTLNVSISISTQFHVVLRNQAIRDNFDLCLIDV